VATYTQSAPTGALAAPVVPKSKGRIVVNWITSTDHKTIGYMYLIASFVFFCLGGVMALLIRAELFEPGMQILQTKEQYNQLFTMHGTVMLLMFATPLFAGFANVIMPLQIGAPDVAFPRLNALAFWFFLFGSTIAVSGFITPRAGTVGCSVIVCVVARKGAKHTGGEGGRFMLVWIVSTGFVVV
jgi:cytochrome c oxidase subunit 1